MDQGSQFSFLNDENFGKDSAGKVVYMGQAVNNPRGRYHATFESDGEVKSLCGRSTIKVHYNPARGEHEIECSNCRKKLGLDG